MTSFPRSSRPLGQTTMLSDGTARALLRSRARGAGRSSRRRGRPGWMGMLLRRAVGLVALALPYAAWAELPEPWLPFAPPVGVEAWD